MFGHAFEELDDIVLLHKAHFAVNLCEFGLTVGAEVFVAEALHNLEVAVHARYHEQLLESLGRLRQCVELSRIHTRGHHEVAGAFGSGADEHRGFDFEEAFAVEVATHFHGHAVAQLEVAAHGIATDVEVAVTHADVVAAVAFVFNCEGRNFAGIEYVELVGDDFDVAGRELRVLGSALSHFATDLYHKFTAEVVGGVVESAVVLGVEHHLSDAVAVAEVDKCHAAHFAYALYPAGESHFAAGVGEA